MFKIISDRHIKICRSLKRRAILIITNTAFLLALKNPSKMERFPVLRQKATNILQ